MREDLSPELRSALSGFDDALGELRTRRIRASRLTVPDVRTAGPEDFAKAAASPSASTELKAVAKAVAEGRVTWQDVADGRVDAAPEIRELVLRGAADVAAAYLVEQQAPAARPESDGAGDEDFSQSTFMYDPLR